MSSTLDANRLGALWSTLDALMAQAQDDFSPSSAAILLTLHYHAPLSVNALAAIVDLSQPACSRAVDRLLEAGLVEKERVRGMETGLGLTAPGRAEARRLQQRRLGALGKLLDALAPEEQQAFNGLVDKLLKAPVTDRTYARRVCRFCDHKTCDGPDCPIGCAATALEGRGKQ
jgi:DNA-binding MarR family transcriptional regulator